MARFPAAVWRGPVPNESPGRMGRPVGLVLHIEQGSEAGTDQWFHNPGAQASAHFGNPKTGPLDQWVDTADMAWAEVAGNPQWISVEHEGYSGEQLTPSQLENDAQLLAWLHTAYGVPLQPTDTPAVGGLGWHGMGGQAWGDHLDCPGAPIVAQRPAIVTRAQQLVGATSTPPSAPTPTPSPVEDTVVSPIVTFRPGQLDAFQVSAGTLWHKWGPTAGGAWSNESVPAQCNGGKGIGQVTFPDQQPQVSTTAVPGAVCVTVEDAGGRAWMFFQGATGPWQVVELP